MLYSLLDYIKKMSASASSNGVVINEELLLLLTLSCSVAVTVVTFVLKGIGLYTIAKRENVKKPYYAFIPFLSFYLLGKIVGGVKIFGYHVKNVGLITMITMLLYYVTAAVYDGFMCYENIVGLFTTGKLGSVIDKYGSVWIDVVLSVLMTVSRLVYVVFGIFMIFTFFLYYGGKYQLLFSLLSIFFDPLFGIFVFGVVVVIVLLGIAQGIRRTGGSEDRHLARLAAGDCGGVLTREGQAVQHQGDAGGVLLDGDGAVGTTAGDDIGAGVLDGQSVPLIL